MLKINHEKDSELLKALGHPIRLKIVDGLMSGHECNVNKIVKELQIPQSTVSQHLKVLRSSAIIDYHKKGVITCYHVINERVKDIIKVLKK
ncbi:MAG: metalloregulator ArsR/SmtB family transcription factor [Candidatus Omnitrophica bacterium]|nr:metalloregulator ArsR/SmtB family transcription factor [Candidatus Omnitrophota bacterium]